VSSSTNPNIKPVQAVLRIVLAEKGVLSNEERAFDALLASLASSKKWSPSHATFTFVDNCVERVVRQPVHYLDLITLTLGEGNKRGSDGALIACIAEQWPFVAKNDDLDAQRNVAEWIARFFSALGEVAENASQRKIAPLQEHMLKSVQNTPGSVLEKAFKKQGKHPIKLESPEDHTKPEANGDVEMYDVEEKRPEVSLEEIFGIPARSPDSVQGLDRWDNVDLESAVSSGRLGRLLQCVVSKEEEIRRQAFLLLGQLMAIVKV
jgi:nucleolar pre-ribosomal-associated protein 1